MTRSEVIAARAKFGEPYESRRAEIRGVPLRVLRNAQSSRGVGIDGPDCPERPGSPGCCSTMVDLKAMNENDAAIPVPAKAGEIPA